MPVVDRGDVVIPEEYVDPFLDEASARSLALSTFRRVDMGTKISHLPVIDALPVAKWVTGEVSDTAPDDGVKPATEMSWTTQVLTAEEVAAVVVIPDAVIEDAGGTRLWDAIIPRLGAAIGATLDAAVFFGTNAPASFPDGGIVDGATDAGHVVTAAAGATPDADDFNASLAFVEADGYVNNIVYAGTRMKAGFRGWNAGGVPIYLTDLRSDSAVDSIYGIRVEYDDYGLFAANQVAAINGDSQNAILGVRRDLTLKFSDQSMVDVSAAQDGSQLVNLFQQNASAYKISARFAFIVANPVTYAGVAAATRFPFAVIKTTTV